MLVTFRNGFLQSLNTTWCVDSCLDNWEKAVVILT